MNLIPSPDPLGLPAPAWFILLLLIVTQVLHFVFMNFVLGGSWFLVWLMAGKEAWKGRLAARCLNMMPVCLSLAITFGVAPLLFVQVLYGHFFYVSNILLGWYWLGLLALVMIAFYSIYILKAEGDTGYRVAHPLVRLTLQVVIALLFTTVAMAFTTNASLSQHPAVWEEARMKPALLAAWSGIGLLLPRFLHNFVGSLGITGIWILWIAAVRGQEEEATRGAKSGVSLALGASTVQVMIGFWYLLSLPGEVLKAIMTFHSLAAAGLVFGILMGVGMLFHLFLLFNDPGNTRLRWIATGLAAGTLLGMVTASEGLRQALLQKHFTLSDWIVHTQWGATLLFLALFLAGAGTVIWISKVAWEAHNPGQTE